MDASLAKNKANRLLWLDFGKAAGILIVLLVHAGWELGPVSFYGGMFYMPVFFVAAGYTRRRREGERYIDFLKKKARRLLVPYAAVNGFLWFFFWLKDSALAGNPYDLKLWSLFGILYSRNQFLAISALNLVPEGEAAPGVLLNILNSPTWFLTALFLTYAYYEAVSRTRKKALWLVIGLALSAAWHYTSVLFLPWSIDAVPYFACFFAAGALLREKRLLEKGRRYWPVVLVLFVLLARWNGSVNLSVGNYGRSMLVYLVVGTAGSVLVFWFGMALERWARPLAGAFGVAGQQTLLILCFHMFIYMFLQTAGSLMHLPEALAKLLMVAGAAAILTAAGVVYDKRAK